MHGRAQTVDAIAAPLLRQRRGRRLAWLLAGFVLVSLSILALEPLWLNRRIQTYRSTITDVLEPAEEELDHLTFAFSTARSALHGYVIVRDPQLLDLYRQSLSEWDKTMARLRRRLNDKVPNVSDELSGLDAQVRHWRGAAGTITAAADPAAAFRRFYKEQSPLVEGIRRQLTRIDDTVITEIRTERATIDAYTRLGDLLTFVLVLAALVSAALVTYLVTNLQRASAEREAMLRDERTLRNQLQAAVTQRDEMLAIVSHDLRNPLTVIVSSASVIQRRVPPESREHHLVAAILRAAARMNHLIRDLLDVAKIEAQQQLHLEREALDVAALVREAVESVEARAQAKGLIMQADAPDGLPKIDADRYRLLQVLGNLLDNAVKFTPEGGRIALQAMAASDHVQFRIGNSGSLIPADDLPHVFDRFWQARRTQRTGTGLGLAICKGLVEAHGGRIWAESTAGADTAFTFTIPQAGQRQQAA